MTSKQVKKQKNGTSLLVGGVALCLMLGVTGCKSTEVATSTTTLAPVETVSDFSAGANRGQQAAELNGWPLADAAKTVLCQAATQPGVKGADVKKALDASVQSQSLVQDLNHLDDLAVQMAGADDKDQALATYYADPALVRVARTVDSSCGYAAGTTWACTFFANKDLKSKHDATQKNFSDEYAAVLNKTDAGDILLGAVLNGKLTMNDPQTAARKLALWKTAWTNLGKNVPIQKDMLQAFDTASALVSKGTAASQKDDMLTTSRTWAVSNCVKPWAQVQQWQTSQLANIYTDSLLSEAASANSVATSQRQVEADTPWITIVKDAYKNYGSTSTTGTKAFVNHKPIDQASDADFLATGWSVQMLDHAAVVCSVVGDSTSAQSVKKGSCGVQEPL